MNKTKTSTVSNGLIWFGAAVSIAEILTGTLVAPLGMGKGFAAILLGHLIGCVLLYFAGLIGAATEKSAMETVKLSFGKKGSVVFSVLNVLQLIGWTAVMIVSGSAAADSVIHFEGSFLWPVIIGGLIIIWILIGLKNLGKINTVAMSALFVLTMILSAVVLKGEPRPVAEGGLSFGAAVELSVAMPLSWLPLIADYTRNAKKKRAATVTSVVVYFIASCWMFFIGMGAAIFTGENDIAKIMTTAGLGIAGLVIIVFSTVTTTFLDAYSAGVSAVSISPKVNEKCAGIVVCVIGIALAVFTPITQFENFLYLIGSVFAPMIAIVITDYFVLKKDLSEKSFDLTNFVLWLIGFAIYRMFMKIDTPVGNTLPVMMIISILCVLTNKILGGRKDV